MRRLLLLPMALAGMALLPSLALAHTLTKDKTPAITEAMILRQAMQNGEGYHAALAQQQNEIADAEQASRLENPTVDISTVRTKSPGGNETAVEVEIEQNLKLSQINGQRSRLSRMLYDQADLRAQHRMIQAYWDTKTLYAQAWQAQEQVRLYTAYHKRARDVSAQIDKAVKAGQTPISDGSLFAGDVARYQSELERIKAVETQLRLRLESSTGLNLSGLTLKKPALENIAPDLKNLEAQAQENASLVRMLENDLRAAALEKSIADMDSAPSIAPRFIYGKSNDSREDSLGVGITFSIPLWDRNQAERKKATAAQNFARSQLDRLENLPLPERLARIVDVIKRLDSRITTLEKNALPHYRKGFQQAERSFTAGQSDAVALWQIRERLFETERESLDAMIEGIEARRVLSLETGVLPAAAYHE